MNDLIYLLSIEEYEKYRNKVPNIRGWWWLRTPGCYNQNYAAAVFSGDSVSYDGFVVDYTLGAVRPALNYSALKSEISKSKKSSCFIWNEVKWVIIDEENEIAISERPIAFTKFDDVNNDYEHSYIRKWLLVWAEKARRV